MTGGIHPAEFPTDIYIVGTGMVGYRQMTLESLAAVRHSKTVYLVHYQKSVGDFLEDEVASEIPGESGDVVYLTEEYEEGSERTHTYDRMAQRVLDGAKETDEPVTFALYGHPMVFVSPSRIITERAPEMGLETEIRPGISATDCLYCDLDFDPAAHGVHMFEASDLLLREFELDPEVPAFIWQIGAVETSLYSTAHSDEGRFTRIREYLERFYPPDHEMALCQTATYPITESQQIEFELHDMEAVADEINGVQTLYIPPVTVRELQNEELNEQMQSSEHLETITKRPD